jgi:PAS domain S-box-containing protein
LVFLSQVSELLSSSLDFDEMLRQLGRVLVPKMADGYCVYALSARGTIERIVTTHADPAKLRLSDALCLSYPEERTDPRGLPNVLRTGKSELDNDITDAHLVEQARDEEHLRLLRALDFTGKLTVPLRAAGRTLGAITLLAGHSRPPFTEIDRIVAELIGFQAGAAALGNARLSRRPEGTDPLADSVNARLLEEVRAGEERYQSLLSVLSAIVWTADAEGQFSVPQSSWEAFTGQTWEEHRGFGWINAIHPEDRDDVVSGWRRARKEKVACEVLGRIRCGASGSYRHVVSRAIPLWGPHGSVREWVGTVTDVHDQKIAEEERARLFKIAEAERHRASEANRAKDEFLAVVSHELRTPLNAMMGWTQVLRTGALTEERREQGLEVLERNVKAQAQLIEDLLDVSRIIAGKLHLTEGRVDLAEVVAAAADVVRPAADTRAVRLGLRCDPDAGFVMGDADRLQQVVWNLLANAVKFTPSGGKVEVRLRRAAQLVEIVVEDNGQGIAADFLPFVFERFKQAEGGTTRKHGGLGLGLAIVRHIVELHGGRIEAHSEGAGRGATFTVQIPICPASSRSPIPGDPEAPPPSQTSPLSRPSGLRGLRVVIVDDEPDARELLASLFEHCEARAMIAASAAAALQLVREMRPDVLVSDIGLPEEDGYSLIQKIRALPPDEGGRTPAVALTAYARLEDRVRALEAGYDMHIAKPIEPSALLTAVAGLTGRCQPG